MAPALGAGRVDTAARRGVSAGRRRAMSRRAEQAEEAASKIRAQLRAVESAEKARISRLGALGALVMTAAAVYALPHFDHTRAVISAVILGDETLSPRSKGPAGADSGEKV